MIFGIGSDLVDVRRIEKLLLRFNGHFEKKLFTTNEQCMAATKQSKGLFYAKRFAAKEAFVKALGTGISGGISWKNIEIRNTSQGKPALHLDSSLEAFLNQALPRGAHFQLDLSLADEYPYAQAFVVISYTGTENV
jgi:holo-[acyl-carrier protein] synthase